MDHELHDGDLEVEEDAAEVIKGGAAARRVAIPGENKVEHLLDVTTVDPPPRD
jgi:hypothetical protein